MVQSCLTHSGATHTREGFASLSRDCIAADRGVVSAVVVSLSCFLVGVAFLGAMAVLTRMSFYRLKRSFEFQSFV